MTIDVMNKYQLSALATSMEEEDLVRAALEEQVHSFGWNEDEAEGVIEGALASDKGIKTAVSIYAGKYQDALYSLNFRELFDAYDDTLRDFLGDDSEEYERARNTAEEYREQNYGDVAKAVKKAQAQVKNAKALGLSVDEVDSAKETLERHARVMNVLAMLERNKLEALRPQVVRRATKRGLKDILKE